VQFPVTASQVAVSQMDEATHFGCTAQHDGLLPFVYAIWHGVAGQFLGRVWLSVTHFRDPIHCC
jgi:hypothetical protein